jgi:DNA-binding HxlR family transcriptional regulator
MAVQKLEGLLTFFKALADANRLKIIGVLAQGEFSVEQLAAMLKLRSSTVSHHLSRLSRAGLVSARAEGYYNVYRLEASALDEMTKTLLSRETLPDIAASVNLKAYDQQVVANYSLPGGRLKTIPAQRKKLESILRYISQAFEPGVRYSERQVNEILARFHEDTATLRRELVGYRLLSREGGGGAYWLTENGSGGADGHP